MNLQALSADKQYDHGAAELDGVMAEWNASGSYAREHTSLREHYAMTMPRAKKPAQLSAKERALLNRLNRLSEDEIKRLTTRELFAYFKLIDKADSKAVRSELEEVCVDLGLTNEDIRRMVERAKWKS